MRMHNRRNFVVCTVLLKGAGWPLGRLDFPGTQTQIYYSTSGWIGELGAVADFAVRPTSHLVQLLLEVKIDCWLGSQHLQFSTKFHVQCEGLWDFRELCVLILKCWLYIETRLLPFSLFPPTHPPIGAVWAFWVRQNTMGPSCRSSEAYGHCLFSSPALTLLETEASCKKAINQNTNHDATVRHGLLTTTHCTALRMAPGASTPYYDCTLSTCSVAFSSYRAGMLCHNVASSVVLRVRKA